jgi:hypothetical protein
MLTSGGLNVVAVGGASGANRPGSRFFTVPLGTASTWAISASGAREGLLDDLLGRMQVPGDQEEVAEQAVDRGRVEVLEACAGCHAFPLGLDLAHRYTPQAGDRCTWSR